MVAGGCGACGNRANDSGSSESAVRSRGATHRPAPDSRAQQAVISYRFGPEDLGRVRFAISPLFEIAASLDVLRDPARHAMHAPWVASARERLAGLDLALLEAVVPPASAYRPDFVHPPPERPRAGFASELARVRATPPEQVARDLDWAYEGATPPAAARVLLDDPPRGMALLTEMMTAYWRRVIEPHWPAIRATLEADIAYRARRLAEGGPLAAFADLHEEASWRDGALVVARPYESTVELAGRGLLLVPVAFAWPQLWAMIDPPWKPAVVYAPRGVATLWEPAEPATGALADLLGRRRAAILATLPATTQELARAHAASPAGVSEHLAVLRRAGLVEGRREGRAVRYGRTAAGDALVAASETGE
jgi:DNA-binding transcriptional ArsR family regulator